MIQCTTLMLLPLLVASCCCGLSHKGDRILNWSTTYSYWKLFREKKLHSIVLVYDVVRSWVKTTNFVVQPQYEDCETLIFSVDECIDQVRFSRTITTEWHSIEFDDIEDDDNGWNERKWIERKENIFRFDSQHCFRTWMNVKRLRRMRYLSITIIPNLNCLNAFCICIGDDTQWRFELPVNRLHAFWHIKYLFALMTDFSWSMKIEIHVLEWQTSINIPQWWIIVHWQCVVSLHNIHNGIDVDRVMFLSLVYALHLTSIWMSGSNVNWMHWFGWSTYMRFVTIYAHMDYSMVYALWHNRCTTTPKVQWENIVDFSNIPVRTATILTHHHYHHIHYVCDCRVLAGVYTLCA